MFVDKKISPVSLAGWPWHIWQGHFRNPFHPASSSLSESGELHHTFSSFVDVFVHRGIFRELWLQDKMKSIDLVNTCFFQWPLTRAAIWNCVLLFGTFDETISSYPVVRVLFGEALQSRAHIPSGVSSENRTWKNMILLPRRAYRISAIGTFSTQLTFPGFTDGTGTFARSCSVWGAVEFHVKLLESLSTVATSVNLLLWVNFKGCIDIIIDFELIWSIICIYRFRYICFIYFSKKHT